MFPPLHNGEEISLLYKMWLLNTSDYQDSREIINYIQSHFVGNEYTEADNEERHDQIIGYLNRLMQLSPQDLGPVGALLWYMNFPQNYQRGMPHNMRHTAIDTLTRHLASLPDTKGAFRRKLRILGEIATLQN